MGFIKITKSLYTKKIFCEKNVACWNFPTRDEWVIGIYKESIIDLAWWNPQGRKSG